jgi:hypothetical protein
MSEDNGNSSILSRLPFGALVIVFLLTLAVWIFFYEMNMPLQAPATTVVAALMLGIVIVARWARSRRSKGHGN